MYKKVFLLGLCVSTAGLTDFQDSLSTEIKLGEMAASTDLVAVGCEAFALLEECLVRKPRPPPLHQSHHYRLHDQLPSVTTPVFHTKEAIDSHQAALMYGGVSIVEYYRNRKPLPSFRKV